MVQVTPSEVVRSYVGDVQRARKRQTQAAWRRVAELLDEDVRWRFAGGGADTPWPVEITGRKAVVAALTHPSHAWTRMRTDTISVQACESVVLVEQVTTLLDERGTVIVKPVAHVFTVTDGLIAEIRTYRNDQRPTRETR